MKKHIPLLLFGLLLSCGESNDLNLDKVRLEPISTHDSINDTIYFGLISDIKINKNSIYLSDIKSGNIIETDLEFNFRKKWGRKGEGPGEFLAPMGSTISEESLFTLDDGPSEILEFNLESGKYIKSYNQLLPTSGEFVIDKNFNFYGSRLEFNLTTPPMYTYAIGDSSSLKHFGSHKRVVPEFNSQMPRHFFLSQYRDKIIAICENDPVVEIYNFNLDLISSFNYSNLSHLNNYMGSQIEKQKIDNKMVANIVTASAIDKNNLYILVPNYDKTEDKVVNNLLLRFDLKEKYLKPNGLFELGNSSTKEDGFYYSFDVNNNVIFAFDAKSYEVHKYNLND